MGFLLSRRRFLSGALGASFCGLSNAHAGGIPGLYWPDQFRGHVCLTFDDGPHPRYTRSILDILKENDIKATFFVCGRRVVTWPEVLRRIYEEGHCIGNHTWSHPMLGKQSYAQIKKEFERTEKAIHRALGFAYPIHYYRPPFGHPWFSNHSGAEAEKEKIRKYVLEKNGMIILWQLSVGDTRANPTEESIYKSAKSSLFHRKGGVYCMHDNNGRTVRALPNIIAYLKQKEMRFSSLDELISLKYAI